MSGNSASKIAVSSGAALEKAKLYSPAKEIIPGGGFINSKEFSLKDLVGKKVILLDFWTYSCINCLRTLPYLKMWHQKYKDQGLEIIGMHTPEFDFEKDYSNVSKAVKDLGVEYSVVQDNNYSTWNAYKNKYWPHEYLIDIDGYIVHDKIGEGGYDQTEREIQAALKERDRTLGLPDTVPGGIVNPTDAVAVSQTEAQSPETYFGAGRNEYLGNGARGAVGKQRLSLPPIINENTLYLDGEWNFENQFAENSGGNAKIIYKYSAKNVYFVASSKEGINIKILKDGKESGNVFIKDNKLYKLIGGSDYGDHTIEIQIEKPGLQAFTFTFG